MSTTSLITTECRVRSAQQFIENFKLTNNYLFIGDYTNHSNSDISEINTSQMLAHYNPWNVMVLGKLLSNSDVFLAIKNKPYESGVVWDMYDDADNNTLDTQDFYAVVNAVSQYHVFKCLDNNMGANSTVAPDFGDISGANVITYETADGYRWKYMYSVDTSTVNGYGTSAYFPVVTNTATEAAAVPGSINIIKVDDSGALYDNYIAGTFNSSDLSIDGSSLKFKISAANTNPTTGFYTGCVIYLTLGTGIGQYQIISNFYANSSGNYIVTANSFPIAPLNGTQYEITPQCLVTGNGNETINCVARALVNSLASNGIYRVEVLDQGRDYTIATANIVANAVVVTSTVANVRPIISPPGGHGANTATELYAYNVVVGAKLSNSESNTILTTNKFQQIGLIVNPMFYQANLTLSNTTGYFDGTNIENVFAVAPLPVTCNVTINTTSDYLVGPVGSIQNGWDFVAGDRVLITDDSYTVTAAQLANVVTAANDTHLQIDSNGQFATANAVIWNPRIYSTMECTYVESQSAIAVSNIAATSNSGRVFETSAKLIGESSGTLATVDTITRSNVTKPFNTFIQLHKYAMSAPTGTFIQNETVTQGSQTGILHSYYANNIIYISMMSQPFSVGPVNIVGETSGAISTLTAHYPSELVPSTGEMLYVENIDPVTRQENQYEQFVFVFNY